MPSALALESLVNEVGFMVGPIVVVALSASLFPIAGLIFAAGLVLVGTLLMIARSESDPVRQERGPGILFDTRLLRHDFIGFPILHLVFGIYFGSAALGLTAAAIDNGVAGFAGAIAAAGGVISLIAGFLYGTRAERGNPVKVLVIASLVMAALLALLAASTGMIPLIVLYAVAAGCLAPMLIRGGAAAALLARGDLRAVQRVDGVGECCWHGNRGAARGRSH